MPAHNMQFRKRRFSWLFEAFCPAKSFVTVDNDDTAFRLMPYCQTLHITLSSTQKNRMAQPI